MFSTPVNNQVNEREKQCHVVWTNEVLELFNREKTGSPGVRSEVNLRSKYPQKKYDG